MTKIAQQAEGFAKPARNAMDLRTWLSHLEQTGRLAIARHGVDLRFELAGVANRCDGNKATLFPAPSGARFSVISGLLSQRAWMAEALGLDEAEMLRVFQHACAEPLAPNLVQDGPCQENVQDGEFDIRELLPIPTHNEHDSGAYITAGVLICKNPRTGVQNLSIHRLQVSGPRELGALLLPRHTLAFFAEAEKTGADLDVAIAVGLSPACLLASQAIVPLDFDEIGVAGHLSGRPIDVVKCLGSEILVPTDTEVVIEGKLLNGARAPEGPFGEFPQYYGERADRHVIRIDRVTHRTNALFHTIVGGGLEHLLLGGIPREATILSTLRRNFPNVQDVHLAHGGVCRYHLYVQIDGAQPGGAKNVILGAMAAHYDIKHVVVVDSDVNIHNPEMVEWAVATRFQADRDLIVVPDCQGSKLDPSTNDGVGAKMGFDATVPAGADPFRFKRIAVPGQEDINLDAIFQPTTGLADILGE